MFGSHDFCDDGLGEVVPSAHVHDVICDGCKTQGISGFRYKCCSCGDYDLCPNCFANRASMHDPTHQFWVYTRPGRRQRKRVGGVLVHTGVICDVCNDDSHPIIGTRYSCKTCSSSYDLCQAHFDTLVQHHDGTHAFWQYRHSRTHREEVPRIVHEGILCDMCNPVSDGDFLVGSRYRCKICSDYDLCEKHFVESIHDHFGGQHHFQKFKRPGIYELSSGFPLDCIGVIMRFVGGNGGAETVVKMLRCSRAVNTYIEKIDPRCCENVMFRMTSLRGIRIKVRRRRGGEFSLGSRSFVGRLRIVASESGRDISQYLKDSWFGPLTFPNLHFLFIEGNREFVGLTDSILANFPNLRRLVLHVCPGFTNLGFRAVTESLEALMIDDSSAYRSTKVTAEVLNYLPNLTKLHVQAIDFYHNSTLDAWSQMTKLEKLYLWHTGTTDCILEYCGPTLRVLEAHHNHHFRVEGLRHCVSLEKLAFVQSGKVSAREEVTQALPHEVPELEFAPRRARRGRIRVPQIGEYRGQRR